MLSFHLLAAKINEDADDTAAKDNIGCCQKMRLPKKVIIMSGNEFHPFYSAGLSQCRKKEKKAIRLYWNSRESAGKRKRSGHVGCCHQLTLCFALFYWISTIASFQSTPRRHLRRKLTIDPFTAEIRPQFRPHLADFLQRWRRRIPHPTHSFFSFFLSPLFHSSSSSPSAFHLILQVN